MSCFDNLIGIRGYCDDPESDSGLYLQDLPMVTLKNADAIVTTQNSGFELLQQLLSRSYNYVIQDAVNMMAPFFRQSSVIEQSVVGYYPEQMLISTGANNYMTGIEVRILEYPYLEFFLSQVTIFCDFTGNVDLKIYDLKQNKLLDTITIAALAGQMVTVDINKTYKTNKQVLDLFIGYDSTGINPYKSNLTSNKTLGGCRSCGSVGSYGNRFVMFYPRKIATASNKIVQNLESVNGTSGLSITYNINCNIEPYLCSIKNRLAMPILHRAGMEIMNELKVSDRLSSVVVFQKKEIEATYQYFEGIYKQGMTNVFGNLQLPKDVCFRCNETYGNGIAMP